jgi:membrane protein YqaA with SNARE-associated domain
MLFLRQLQTRVLRQWLWFKEKAQGPRAILWLSTYSFFETLILPFPTDPFLVAVVAARRREWLLIAFWATFASIAASVIGYVVGFAAFDALGAPLISGFGLDEQFAWARDVFEEHAFLITFAALFTFIPNLPVILAAGFFGSHFFAFLAAVVIGRAMRFFGVGYAAYVFGTEGLSRSRRAFDIVTILALLALIWFITKSALTIVQ